MCHVCSVGVDQSGSKYTSQTYAIQLDIFWNITLTCIYQSWTYPLHLLRNTGRYLVNITIHSFV